MELFQDEIVISKIIVAIFYPKEKGTPIQKSRTTHGLVFNVDCWSTYRFDTGEVLRCRSGDCIYLPKGSHYTAERYMERNSENRGIYAINFLTYSQDDDQINKPFVMHVRGKDELLSLFSKAATAWQRKGVGFYEECFIDLYKIIQLLKRETAQYSPEKRTLAAIAPALDYINEHYTKENISLAHLADLCGMSQTYLRKLFHHAFSVSPSVYMRNLRIRYAKELLQTREYSVTDVAILSGFNDAAYFSREFKKATGISPKDYGTSI